MNRTYYMPTKVFMGKDCVIKNGEVFQQFGKKALIVTGKRSAKVNGSEKDVKMALEAQGIAYVIYDQVMSNPTIDCVYEGATLAKENNVDFIIAIGGGSPIDAAKGMALVAAQDISKENLFSGNYTEQVLPLIAIPTTAGTGSEVTQYSILTNDKAETKTSIATALIFPKVAFLDEKYMEKLGVITTINTGIDALSHAVEGMLSVKSSIVSDALALESIRMIMGCVPKMLEALNEETTKGNGYCSFDQHTRKQLLYASFLAGMVIAQTGTTAVHAMGYSLTYFKDIDHGRANGLLLGEYLRLVENKEPALIKKIITAMNVESVNAYITLMDKLFGEKEKISRDEIQQFSEKTMATKNINNCIVKPTLEDVIAMYEVSFSL